MQQKQNWHHLWILVKCGKSNGLKLIIDLGKTGFVRLRWGMMLTRVTSFKKLDDISGQKILKTLKFQSLMANLQLTSTSKQTPVPFTISLCAWNLVLSGFHHTLCTYYVAEKVSYCLFIYLIWLPSNRLLLLYRRKFLHTVKLGDDELGFSKHYVYTNRFF